MHETHHLAHRPASVAVARHRLRDALEQAGVGETVVYDAMLVLSELVSNAVQHGRPTADGHLDVSWTLSGEKLVIEVADGGQTTSLVPQPRDPESDRGRGLVIVDDVCDSWRVDRRDGTTRVVAEMVLAMA